MTLFKVSSIPIIRKYYASGSTVEMESNGNVSNDFTDTDKANLASTVTNSHTHSNKTILDSISEAFTTALKATYDAIVSFPGFGTSHTVAAYGDHTHSQYLTKSTYALAVFSNSIAVTNGSTIYFGNKPVTPATSEGRQRIYFRTACTITAAELNSWAGTNGTSENVSLYIRVNATTDHLIATVGAASMEKKYSNTGLSISIAANDFIEIKVVYPTFATPPSNTGYGGYLMIEK